MNTFFNRICLHRRPLRSALALAGFAATLFAISGPAAADFAIARLSEVESRPAVALNAQTGEFYVAYLRTVSSLPNDPVELRLKRFNSAGSQLGGELQPLGSASHEALGRPAIAYSTVDNRILVAVPVKKDGFSDRVLARFINPDGSNDTGPDFMFDTGVGFYDDGQTDDGNGSLQITYNSILNEFVITVQLTAGTDNKVFAQKLSSTGGAGATITELNNHGINGQNSHDIEYAAVSTTSPVGGRYLFINNGSFGTIRVLDANLNTVAVPSVDWGAPQGGTNHQNISYGRVDGKDRWLIVWTDDDNCWPGMAPCPNPAFQWTGVWGTYLDPLNPGGVNNTAFPISKINTHVVTDSLLKPRVGYNRDAESFYVAWREVPVLDPLNDESRSHIRGNRIDYFVPDGVPGALVPLPPDNVALSAVSGTCPPSGPCFSDEDPTFPDVSANMGWGAVAVWHEKYVVDPSDLDVWGDFMTPPVPGNNSMSSPAVFAPGDPSLEATLIGSSNDGTATCGFSSAEPDVWFRFEAPVSGTLLVNTCGTHDLYGEDSGMDTVISVHDLAGTQLSPQTCSDDWPFTAPGTCSGSDNGFERDSALEVALAMGQEVLVRVSRYEDTYGGRFVMNHGFAPDPDSDGDGVPDPADNCLFEPNPGQRDTDGDDIGNVCDPDIAAPNDCFVDFLDLGVVKAAFFGTPASGNWNPDTDFNGDNFTDFLDLGVIKAYFFQAPGPSGLPNACGP